MSVVRVQVWQVEPNNDPYRFRLPDPNSKLKATLCQRLRALDDSGVAFVVEKIPVPSMLLKNLQNSSEPAFNEDTCLAEFLAQTVDFIHNI